MSDTDAIRECLAHLRAADLDHAELVIVAAVAKDNGFTLPEFESWFSKTKTVDPAKMETHWQSLRGSSNPAGIGSLVQLCRAHGGEPRVTRGNPYKPAPDPLADDFLVSHVPDVSKQTFTRRPLSEIMRTMREGSGGLAGDIAELRRRIAAFAGEFKVSWQDANGPLSEELKAIKEVKEPTAEQSARLDFLRRIDARLKEIKAFKSGRLPGFNFGTFQDDVRKADKLEAAELMMFDADHAPDPAGLKSRIAKHKSVFLCFISPSGDGVKFAARVPKVTTKTEFTRVYKLLSARLSAEFGAALDRTSDANRLCFLAHDSDLHHNPAAVPMDTEATPAETKAAAGARLAAAEQPPGEFIDPETGKSLSFGAFVAAMAGRGEAGDGELYAATARDRKRFNYTSSSWMDFTAGRWTPDEKEKTLAEIQRQLRILYVGQAEAAGKKRAAAVKASDNETAKREALVETFFFKRAAELNENRHVANVSKVAARALAIVSAELDTDPDIINLRNGTINLRELDFAAHDPALLLSKQANASFDPDATSPRWMDFLYKIFLGDDSLVCFFQRWAGYCLSGRTDLDALLYAYGKGANGKTVLFNVIGEVLGDYATTLPIDTLLARRNENAADKYALADLKGVRLAVASEVPEHRRFNESLVKDLTGGDRNLKTRNPYEKFVQFTPTHKLAVFGNHMLKITGTDRGIWRRIHLLPFKYTFPESEKRERSVVCAELMKESSGILNWLLAGAAECFANGLQPPEKVKAATDDYRQDMDIVGLFISDTCDAFESARVRLVDLFGKMNAWAEGNGEKGVPRTSRDFANALRERGYKVENGAGNTVFVHGIETR